MQRYNVNYKLLIGLLGACVLGAGVLGGLYWYQNQRNAEQFLAASQEARAEGNLLGAAKNLYMYCVRRPQDTEAEELMVETFALVAEEKETEPNDRARALNVLESTLRKQRNNDKLRRRFIDLLMDMGYLKQASEHLEIMVNDHPQDAEMMTKLTRCYVGLQQNKRGLTMAASLVGYDTDRRRFDKDAKAVDPTAVDAYAYLGALLTRTKAGDKEIDQVFEQAVKANPQSAKAHVIHARRLLTKGEEFEDQAVQAVDNALEADSEDLEALILRSQLHAQEEQYDEAKALLDRAYASKPDTAALYLTAASILNRADGIDASLDWLTRGVENTSGNQQLIIKVAEARALIGVQRLDEARQVMAELDDEQSLQKVLRDYLHARLKVGENKWFEASQELTKIRPELTGNRELSEELNAMLALCFTRLEQWEKVDDSARRTLQINPSNQLAKDLLRNAEQKRGRKSSDGAGKPIAVLVQEELRKPKEERNWQSVRDEANKFVDDMIEQGRMNESGRNLLMAEISANAEEYKKAASLIRTAIKLEPENLNTWRLAVRLTSKDPDGGAVKAMKMLDQLVKQKGDSPMLRLDRADLYLQLNDENVSQQMLSVSQDMGEFSQAEQVQVWKGLAQRFEAMRDSESLATAREKVAALAPNELSNLLDMFMAARGQNDDARMQEAQKLILGVVKDEQNASYLFTEAHRLLSMYQRGLAENEALEQAEQLVKRAQQDRPEWHLLNLLLADVAVQRGDAGSALEQLDRAAEFGPPTVRSLLQHVSLLMRRGRYDDAREQMDRAPKVMRENMLGRQYAQALLMSRYLGEREKRWSEAIEVARRVGERAPEELDTQLWLGRFMVTASQNTQIAEETRASALNDAGTAFAKAVELDPHNDVAWRAYVLFLADYRSPQLAESALLDMQLALDEDASAIALAVGYEKLGRWFDALSIYEQALEANPDDLMIRRQLASFYLGGRYPLDNAVQKATPILNGMLKAAEEKPALGNNQHVMWARRTAAKILAQTRDYQKALQAEKLLASNIIDGDLVPEDQITLARILATRPEPAAKLRAIDLYENVLKVNNLKPTDGLTLGQIYFATGQWDACQRQMVEVISENPEFVQARDAYVRILLSHDAPGDLQDAARHLKRLQEFAPTAPSTLELLVRVSDKLGRKKDVVVVLQRLLSKPENRQNPDVITRVASLLADLDEVDDADKLFSIAAKMNPRAKLSYASFLGEHRSLDDALNLLESATADVGQILALQYASALLQSDAAAPEQRHFDRVQEWLEKSLREDPESIKLLSSKAELAGARREYREAADTYRQLLDRKDLEGVQRAIVLNNLAYQVSMDPSEGADFEQAIGYVAEAIDILGPRSDILDTRAVVYMALGQYEKAVADLKLAVTDQPTASKYFHLAEAHMGARQQQAAVDAWNKAEELNLTMDDIGVGERQGYQDLKEKISRIQSSTGG